MNADHGLNDLDLGPDGMLYLSIGNLERRTGFAQWIMTTGAGSASIMDQGEIVISGGCGPLTRVDLHSESGDAIIDEAEHRGCLTVIEPMPDGRILLATVFGNEPFTVATVSELFGD